LPELPRPPPCEARPPIAAISLTLRRLIDANPRPLPLPEEEDDDPLLRELPLEEELLLREPLELPRPPPCEARPPIAAISLTLRRLMDANPRPLPLPEEDDDDPLLRELPLEEELLPPRELLELPRPPPCEARPPIAAISLTFLLGMEANPRPPPFPEEDPPLRELLPLEEELFPREPLEPSRPPPCEARPPMAAISLTFLRGIAAKPRLLPLLPFPEEEPPPREPLEPPRPPP
jgi:hypothetical protein